MDKGDILEVFFNPRSFRYWGCGGGFVLILDHLKHPLGNVYPTYFYVREGSFFFPL